MACLFYLVTITAPPPSDLTTVIVEVFATGLAFFVNLVILLVMIIVCAVSFGREYCCRSPPKSETDKE